MWVQNRAEQLRRAAQPSDLERRVTPLRYEALLLWFSFPEIDPDPMPTARGLNVHTIASGVLFLRF